MLVNFLEKQNVMVHGYCGNNKWVPTVVRSKTGSVSYRVQVDGGRIW